MKRDIPEGAAEYEMPRFGYGRILSVEWLKERYWTVKVYDVRLFVASGLYDRKKRFYRWWMQGTHGRGHIGGHLWRKRK